MPKGYNTDGEWVDGIRVDGIRPLRLVEAVPKADEPDAPDVKPAAVGEGSRSDAPAGHEWSQAHVIYDQKISDEFRGDSIHVQIDMVGEGRVLFEVDGVKHIIPMHAEMMVNFQFLLGRAVCVYEAANDFMQPY